MGEKDAFGREKDEDTLAGLGWTSAGNSNDPSPTPVTHSPSGTTPPPAPPVARPTTVMGAGTDQTRAPMVGSMPEGLSQIPGVGLGFRPLRWVIRLIVVGAVVLFMGGVVSAIFTSVDVADKVTDIIDDVTSQMESVTTPTTSTGPNGTVVPSEPPTGLAPGSLVRSDEFRAAMSTLRAKGGRIQLLRVAPDRIDATVLTSDGKLRQSQVSYSGDLRVFSETSTSIPSSNTVTFASVNKKAPSRAVARAAAKLGKPARELDYLVLLSFAGSPQWSLYFKDGTHFRASADGRTVDRVG